MNTHPEIQLPLGGVDSTLGDLVTTFRLRESAVKELPEWIKRLVPKPVWGGIMSPKMIRSFTGTTFLGSPKHPAQKVWASNLSADLAAIGIVPQSFEMKITGFKNDVIIYQLKIIWSRQRVTDSEQEFERVQRLQKLFDQLLAHCAWDVVGAEFRQKLRPRRVLLSFRGRNILPPSLRHGVLKITDERVVLDRNPT